MVVAKEFLCMLLVLITKNCYFCSPRRTFYIVLVTGANDQGIQIQRWGEHCFGPEFDRKSKYGTGGGHLTCPCPVKSNEV